MIKIILNIAFIAAYHLIIFVLFPDTGKYGHYYLYGFISFWIFIYIYLTTKAFFKNFPFNFFLKILFFLIMITSSLILTPQEDKKSIMKKIISFNFPDSQQIQRGKIKYLNKLLDVKVKGIINPIKENIIKNTNKLLKEMNE